MANPFSQYLSTQAPRLVSSRQRKGKIADGTPGGYGGVDIQALINQFTGSFNAANADSAAQYDALLKGYQGTMGEVNSLYGGAENLMSLMGNTRNRQINENEIKALASSEQDMTSRGLGNTTLRGTARRGIKADTEKARTDLAEQVALMKSGLLERKAGMTANMGQTLGDFMLSTQNQFPDMGSLIGLLQSYAAAGGGGGGSGSGSGRPSGVLAKRR